MAWPLDAPVSARARVIGMAVLALLGASPAAAESPTWTLQRLFARTQAVLSDPSTENDLAARLAAVHALVHDVFDVRHAAERVLGPAWQSRTADERAEFVFLFADLLKRSVVCRLAATADLQDGVRVRYLEEAVDGERATVVTALAVRQGGERPVTYRMMRRDGRWMVHDVVLDGVSLVANYRVQAQRVIQTAAFPDLLALMRAKAGDAPPAMSDADRWPALVETPPDSEKPDAAIDTSTTAESPGTNPVDERDPQPDLAEAGDPRIAAASPQPFASPQPSGFSGPPQPSASPQASVAVAALTTAPEVAPLTTRPVVAAPVAPVVSYWVQLAAFTDLDAGGRFAGRLGEPNLVLLFGRTTRTTGGAAVLLRVRVGPFADRADALATLHDLRARGYRPVLVEGDD